MSNLHRLTHEYRLLRRIGRGGMGEVWEAVRIKGDGIVVPCAIKLLHADFTSTARERKLFLEEARIATQLDHGRIVKIMDVGTAGDGRPFLVMERVDGVDLRSFAEAAKADGEALLELDVVVCIVSEVLSALTYAHARTVGGSDAGIVHSDVTPGNIMISSSGEVKLTDFGIARFVATAGPMSRAVGTPRYMSPEQLSGDPRCETDIYGLGVVLHELLEGQRFMDGLTPDQFRSRVFMGPPPELARKGVPAWLDALRGRMIATDPKQRPTPVEARAVIGQHWRNYMPTVAQIEADYARLIGRRRSGMTLLKLDENGDEEIEPTQLLPATDPGPTTGPGPESIHTSSDSSQVQPRTFGRLAVVSALLALVMGVVSVSLLVKMLRELAADVPVVDEPSELAVPEVAAEAVRLAAPAPEPVAMPEPAPAPIAQPEPTQLAAPAPEPIAQPEPAQAAVLASQATTDEPSPEPASKAKPKPKPALTKVGVIFVVETNQEGQLRIGRKIIPVKNRSAYIELSPAKYTIALQPPGSDEWQNHGQVKIEDISPKRYQVRLDNGKIAGVDQL